MPVQRVKVVNFDVCKWPPKLTGYCRMNVSLFIFIHMSTNCENLVKISPVYSVEGYANFYLVFGQFIAKISHSILAISSVS